MATPAIRKLRKLEGLFCVYKPVGVFWEHVRNTIETNLLKSVNAESVPVPREVRFLANTSNETETEASKALTLSVASVPVLSKHPLVTGPEFQHIRVGVGHRLDTGSSGVLVIGVADGNKTLNNLFYTRTTREYTLDCEFGRATRFFTDPGRVVERSTYDHITLEKIERVTAMLEGANQKAMRLWSNVDMSSQEAYEMAAKGLLGPDGKSVAIITGLRCIHFQPPRFTLEVQCLNETQKYLRKMVHEIGLELLSTAVCTGVRRTRDGLFTLQDALTRNHWTAADVMQAVRKYRTMTRRRKHPQLLIDKPMLERSVEKLTATQQSQTN